MLIEKFMILMKSSSLTKKIMHYGLMFPFYVVPMIKRLQGHWHKPSKSPIKEIYLTTASDIFGIGELFFDHFTYFAGTGLITNKKYGEFSAWCEWMSEFSWHC